MVALALLVHGTILGAATTVVFSFREHAKFIMEMNDKCSTIVHSLRYQLYQDLRLRLRPVFEDRDVLQTTGILNHSGDPWVTSKVYPEGTEAFRNALTDFVRTKADAIDDLRQLKCWVDTWKRWTSFTFWVALTMLIIQSLLFITVAACDQIKRGYLQDHWILLSFGPAAIAILLYCFAQAVTMMANTRIARIADKYA